MDLRELSLTLWSFTKVVKLDPKAPYKMLQIHVVAADQVGPLGRDGRAQGSAVTSRSSPAAGDEAELPAGGGHGSSLVLGHAVRLSAELNTFLRAKWVVEWWFMTFLMVIMNQ